MYFKSYILLYNLNMNNPEISVFFIRLFLIQELNW